MAEQLLNRRIFGEMNGQKVEKYGHHVEERHGSQSGSGGISCVEHQVSDDTEQSGRYQPFKPIYETRGIMSNRESLPESIGEMIQTTTRYSIEMRLTPLKPWLKMAKPIVDPTMVCVPEMGSLRKVQKWIQMLPPTRADTSPAINRLWLLLNWDTIMISLLIVLEVSPPNMRAPRVSNRAPKT